MRRIPDKIDVCPRVVVISLVTVIVTVTVTVIHGCLVLLVRPGVQVGYTGIACRCNYVFCSLHRYPEQHDCTFDFKTSDRNELKRTVVGGGQFSKIDRL